MSTEPDEYEREFLAGFGDTGLRSPQQQIDYQHRVKSDRRSGMARSQRKRKDLRDETFNMRCSRAFQAACELIAKHDDVSKADAVHEAIMDALKQRKLSLPRDQ